MNVYAKEIFMTKFIPEKPKKIALARLDIIHQWLDFRDIRKNISWYTSPLEKYT